MTKLEELKAVYAAYEAVFDSCDAAYKVSKAADDAADADAYQSEQMTYDQFRKLHQIMSLKEPKE